MYNTELMYHEFLCEQAYIEYEQMQECLDLLNREKDLETN